MTDYRKSLKSIQAKLKKELPIDERIQLLQQLLPDIRLVFDNEEDFHSIFEYINSFLFKQQNGQKKKAHPKYEDTYLAIGLSNISDYIMEKWQEWELKNPLLDEYSVQSKYDLNRLMKAGSKKTIVGLDTSVADDFLENGVSETVLKGWEFHVDQLEQNTKYAKDIFNFSEDTKRELRKKKVLEGIEKYPTLKERYIVYKEMGLRYGFDESLSPEQKEELKQQWIEHFSKEKNHPAKPKNRYYRLLKDYNNIGYELSVIQKQLSKQVEVRKNNQPLEHSEAVQENAGAFILGMVKLDIQEHVNGLLTIQKGKKVGEYHPLYIMIKEKYKSGEDEAFNLLESDFIEVLEVADLTKMDRDIVNLILGKHQYNIYTQGNKNPYEYIALYINETYQQRKTKTDIMRMVEKGISKTIANTYSDLEKGLDIKKCTSCRVEKMASTNNYGVDKRNKNGLKSICKRCAAKKAKSRKRIV